MKTIRISDEVWAEIAKRGKFGETEDDVLSHRSWVDGFIVNPTLPPPTPDP